MKSPRFSPLPWAGLLASIAAVALATASSFAFLGHGWTDHLPCPTKGPIRDAEGRVCGLFGVARDITQRKQVEENLRASERKFSTVFHLSPDAIDLTLLETGILMDLNKSHLQLFGYTREELLGHSSLPGDKGLWMNREDRERHVAELKAQGVVLGIRGAHRRKDGSTFLALVSSSLVEIKGELSTFPWSATSPPRNRRSRPCGKAISGWSWPPRPAMHFHECRL